MDTIFDKCSDHIQAGNLVEDDCGQLYIVCKDSAGKLVLLSLRHNELCAYQDNYNKLTGDLKIQFR